MIIKSITIKNVRGFENRTIQLDMIPDKPSMIVAPNGSGKSSIAIAFKSLKPRTLNVDKDDKYQNNDSLSAELVVETDTETLVANSSTNMIKDKIAVFVINNQNQPKTITKKIGGTRVSTSKMQVPQIVLIDNIPQNEVLNNSFIDDNNLKTLTLGTIPNINELINDNKFLTGFDFSSIRPLSRLIKPINDFINRLRSDTGRKADIWNRIQHDDIPKLIRLEMVNKLMNYYKSFTNECNDAIALLAAIQIIQLYLNKQTSFDKKIKYAKYIIERDNYKVLFANLKKTWKNILPKEDSGKFVIEINDTTKLSNGERDIIVFLAMLQQANNTLQKDNNILIIDEIFDYLDDANLIAAQYYITNFIKSLKDNGKHIFPIILSHLSPSYFKSFAFKDLKVYYLDNHTPMYSSKMEKLLNKRAELEQYDKQHLTFTDLISKYMLHYHYDYSVDMSPAFGTVSELYPWKHVSDFKKYCSDETNKYLDGNNYDSVAICVCLREHIEKYIYDKLPTDELKKKLVDEIHGTKDKIAFAEGNGIECPEIFSLLGLIYNEYLHTKNNKSLIDSRETLYSRLSNNTIREMIRVIINNYSV